MQTCPLLSGLLGARAPIIAADFPNAIYHGPHAKDAITRKIKRYDRSLVDGVAALIEQSFSQAIVILAALAGPCFEHHDRTDVAPIIDVILGVILDLINAEDLDQRGSAITAN
jgi:hypothetical protein